MPWFSAPRTSSPSSSRRATTATAATSTMEGHAVPILTRPFPLPTSNSSSYSNGCSYSSSNSSYSSSSFVQTFHLRKDPSTGFVGIRFRSRRLSSSSSSGTTAVTTTVTTIHEVLPSCCSSRINSRNNSNDNDSSNDLPTVGHTVLALDGQPVVAGSSHAAQLVRDARGPYITLITCSSGSQQRQQPCFTRFVAVPALGWGDPSSPHSSHPQQQQHQQQPHPGLVFDTTRNGCLVQLARVAGPWVGQVFPGDIVLAVQDIPVATVADATMALLVARRRGRPYVLLYVVDMAAYRRSILQEISIWKPLAHVAWVEVDDDHNNSNLNSNHNTIKLEFDSNRKKKKNAYVVELQIDWTTQRLIPPQASSDVVTVTPAASSSSNVPSLLRQQNARPMCAKQQQQVMALVHAWNERLEKRMRVLEEAVVTEAWKHQCQRYQYRRHYRHDTPDSASTTANVSSRRDIVVDEQIESKTNDNNNSHTVLTTAAVEEEANNLESLPTTSSSSSDQFPDDDDDNIILDNPTGVTASSEESAFTAALSSSSLSSLSTVSTSHGHSRHPKTPSSDNGSTTSNDDMTPYFLTMATAELEQSVWPWEALQTLEERNNHPDPSTVAAGADAAITTTPTTTANVTRSASA